MQKNTSQLIFIVALLLTHFFVRAHNLQRQEVFVDEAYHLTRADRVYDFAEHPARFSHGKLLLYFWLGLFKTDPLKWLPLARLTIALFSLTNGAILAALGTRLGSRWAGVLALGGYAVLPLAYFFERITLADSFASAFACLAAWRSLILVRKPNLREGALVGVFLYCTLLAKLTMALIPFMTPAACLLFYNWQGKTPYDWGRRFLPPLLMAAGVVILGWLPILIPAALAQSSDQPFVLVDSANLRQIDQAEPVQDLRQILPMIADYTSPALLIAALAAAAYLLTQRKSRPKALFLLIWMGLILVLSLAAASLIRTRYLMPMAAPLVLLLALAGGQVWMQPRFRLVMRGGLVLGVGVWLVGFVLPFTLTMFRDPADLPISQADWVRYMSGNFSGEALRQAARFVNEAQPRHLYAVWGTCQLLFLYVEQPVICLPPSDSNPAEALAAHLAEEIPAGEAAYVILNGDPPFLEIAGWEWELLARYPRPYIDRPVEVWRLRLAE